jgi:hypothetical protein
MGFLARRTFLKAAGLSLILPRLESFGEVPQKESSHNTRLLTIVNHLGFYKPNLIPEKDGKFGQIPSLLKNLEAHQDDMSVFCGFNNPSVQRGSGHTPAVGILSGYYNTLTSRNRISFDQMAADELGKATRFKSLCLQAGKIRDFSQVSWDKHGLPVHQHESPEEVFEMLFGVESSVKEQQAVIVNKQSILDLVLRQANSFNKSVSVNDRQKLDEYFTSVREIEKDLKRDFHWSSKNKPMVVYKKESWKSNAVGDYLEQMLQLTYLAFQTDSTRVITLEIPFWENTIHPKMKENYHNLSHHGKSPEKIAKLQVLENMILKQVSGLVDRLKNNKFDGKTLLDQMSLLITASMGNANAHTFDDLPAIVMGGGFKHGQSRKVNHTPMGNLYLEILQKSGLEIDSFADSTSNFEWS